MKAIAISISTHLALVALTAAAAGTAAAHELVTDRPDQTESAVVVPRGSWQLETGWGVARHEAGGLRTRTHEAPGTLLRIGAHDLLELRLGWQGYVREDLRASALRQTDEALGAAELGAKLHLAGERGWRPETALLVTAAVPLEGGGASRLGFDPELRLSFGHGLSERLELGYNLGVSWSAGLDGGSHALASGLYTAALGFAVAPRLGAFVELFGDLPLAAPGTPATALNGGFTLLLHDLLQLDLFAGTGLSRAAPDWLLGIGFSSRWPR